MNLKREKTKNIIFSETKVENIFIKNYLADAPGDYVKVFLGGLMCSEFNSAGKNEDIGHLVGVSEETVKKAWEYWEEVGAVKKVSLVSGGMFRDGVRFINLRDQLLDSILDGTDTAGLNLNYADSLMPEEEEESKDAEQQRASETEAALPEDMVGRGLVDRIREILNRDLSPRDIMEIYSWEDEYDIPEDLIVCAFEYCEKIGKTHINYVFAVLRGWLGQGVKSREDAEVLIEESAKRQSDEKRILRALGLNRLATEGEKKLIRKWMDEYGFNISRILEACETTVNISNPNLNYVHKVLTSWYEEAGAENRDVNKKTKVNMKNLKQYLDYIRDEAAKEAEKRKKEIYEKIPCIEDIDRQVAAFSTRIAMEILKGNRKEADEIKRNIEKLKMERAAVLTENNYRLDYTDIHYRCDKCNDTGIKADGTQCSCLEKRMEEAEIWLDLIKKK